MATAVVPKLVFAINPASGAGYYAMTGQGFDPDFIFSPPIGRMGVMEGDRAVQAIFGTQLERFKKEGKEPEEAMLGEMEKVRQTYEKELVSKHAAARRGLVDAIARAGKLAHALQPALETCLNTDKSHLGAFILPENL